MAISLVRTATGSGATTPTATQVTVDTSPGDLIVVVPAIYAPNASGEPWSAATVTDDHGNAYAMSRSPTPSYITDTKAAPYFNNLFYAFAATGGTVTVSVATTNATAFPVQDTSGVPTQHVAVLVYSGVDPTNPLVGTAFTNGSGANKTVVGPTAPADPISGYLKIGVLQTEVSYNGVTITHDPGTTQGAFVRRTHAETASYLFSTEDCLTGTQPSVSVDWVNPDCRGAVLAVLFMPAVAATPTTVAPDGITVGVTLGAPTVGDAIVFPDGITVPVALGAPALSWSATATPDGIGVPVALGAPAVGVVSVSPDGLAVAVTVGSPTLTDGSMALAPGGITVPVVLGTPALSGASTAAPDGVSVPVALGSPALSWSAILAPDGITVGVALGSPTVVGAGVSPDGITVGMALGSPALSWSGVVSPDGIAVPVSLGAPGVSMPGTLVIRPNTGTTTRPTTGTTARPAVGTTSRPTTGTVTRPYTGITSRP